MNERTRSARKRGLKHWSVIPVQILVAFAFFAAWQYGAEAGVIDPFFFSTPERILADLIRIVASGLVWPHVWVTLYETVVGFIIGGALGIITGMIVGSSKFLLRIINPFVLFFYSMPRIALAPVFIVILGLGMSSKIATVGFTIYFILLINTVAGIENIQPLWLQSARLMGASRMQLTRTVILPGVLSWIFAGFRVALSLAFASAVVAEFSGATQGVGYQLLLASTNFDTTGGLTWMVVLGIVAVLLNLAVGGIENRLLAWRPTAGR